MKGLLHIFLILALFVHTGDSLAGDPVLEWIENGETALIEKYLEDHNINAVIGSPGTTMLVYSILHASTDMTEWLIGKGADINLSLDGMNPLMYASGLDNIKKVSVLIEAGADIEIPDAEGNTALFYAASNGNLKNVKLLLRRGANLSHKNSTWQTAYDMAVRNSRTETAKYLRDQYEKSLPDLLDGPYISWSGKKTLKAFYLVHDSKSQFTRRLKSKIRAHSDPCMMMGFSGDTLEYLVHSRKDTAPDEIQNAGKILVMGDIHGGYDSLVLFLRRNGIIDPSLQWCWGDGHLVFVGDIFDRGDRVTESLWLIYRLEDQAANAGGAVHFILGNHEIMVLTGDLNYVSDKYLLMTSRLNINYSSLFSRRTVLGQWLRTKNTIIRINGNLFVHAGLSPYITEMGLNITQINEQVRFFLNHPDRLHNEETGREELLGPLGPFWYRGYLEENHEYPHLPEKDLEKVLDYFGARRVFVGHTNVKKITSAYNDRVFAIDVPFYNYGYPIQGLLLKGESIYLLNSSAEKMRIR
jgi:hypothetical protein